MAADMKRQSIILCLLCIAAAVASCKRNEITASILSDRTIGFNIETAETRSNAVTSDNIATEYGSFICDIHLASLDEESAARDSYNQHYVDKATVEYTAEGWKFKMAAQPTWVNGIQSQFWAWAPATVATRTIAAIEPNADQIGFSYTLPAANGTSDASNQKDLVFAYNAKTFRDNAPNPDPNITLDFKHALSEIRFIIEADNLSDIDLPSIKLENVAAKGDFTFATDGTYGCTASGKATYGQNNMFSTAQAGTLSGKKVFYTTNNFFMIPQTVGEDTKVTLKRTSGETLSAGIKAIKATWEAGKYYDYKLSVSARDLSVTLVGWGNRGTNITSYNILNMLPLCGGEDGEQL